MPTRRPASVNAPVASVVAVTPAGRVVIATPAIAIVLASFTVPVIVPVSAAGAPASPMPPAPGGPAVPAAPGAPAGPVAPVAPSEPHESVERANARAARASRDRMMPAVCMACTARRKRVNYGKNEPGHAALHAQWFVEAQTLRHVGFSDFSAHRGDARGRVRRPREEPGEPGVVGSSRMRGTESTRSWRARWLYASLVLCAC